MGNHKKSLKESDRKSSKRKQRHGAGSSGRDEVDVRSHRSSPNNDVQKGITTAKNLLKNSLTSAISEFAEETLGEKSQSSSKASKIQVDTHSYSTLTVLDSVNRQAEIERIEETGFKPSSFMSNADNRKKTIAISATSLDDSGTKDHDRAMFGASWQSKELEKKQNQKSSNTAPGERNVVKHHQAELPQSSYPMAHERLSADPVMRQRKWLELFQQRRKQLMEGTL